MELYLVKCFKGFKKDLPHIKWLITSLDYMKIDVNLHMTLLQEVILQIPDPSSHGHQAGKC